MLFDGSDETPDVAGLGVVPGRVTRLPGTVRLPQMGWNTLDVRPGSACSPGLPDRRWLYFVHTFAPEPADDAVVAAWCDYGRRFAAAVEHGPAVGDAVPPGEVRGRGLAAASEFRRRRGMTMDLYPAIDVRDGKVVRLLQGDYDARPSTTTTRWRWRGRSTPPARAGSTSSTSTPPAVARPATSIWWPPSAGR